MFSPPTFDPAIEPNGYNVPAEPRRFFTVEICCNEVVWAYDDDDLEEAAKSIHASDTTCDERITYDLDETHENGEFERYSPILTVSGWAERKW